MSDLEYHPLANIFPIIEGKEFDDLVADIRTHGVREPIWLYEGKVIDGRNRHRASIAAGADCPMRTYDGADPIGFVISLNLHRRHLNESQRAMVAAKIANMAQGERTDVQPSANLRKVSQERAAEMLNVSERSVTSAAKVKETATPELIREVERGAVSVSAAAEIATLSKDEQAEVVARGKDEIIRQANRIRREEKEKRREERVQEVATLAAQVDATSERYEVFNKPCIDALALDADSVDWIITDPPYPAEFLPVYSDLGKIAAHVLRPGGSLICMIGQSYLPQIIAQLSEHLNYHWTLAYLTPGGQATQIFPRRVNTFWKPVLWFTKGEFAGTWIGDVTKSDPNDNDKRFHHWGQSESGMADLMRRFVNPGDRVLDPFMGAGTTGAVALHLGASFVGFDSDVNSYNETVVRLDRAKMVA